MIEIEKKFLLSPLEEARLLDGATPRGEKLFTDTYYDNAAHDLTLKGFWLRKRDTRFELKISFNIQSTLSGGANQYRELETEPEIYEALGIDTTGNLAHDIEAAGYVPFIECHTNRRSYKKEGFEIDVDAATYSGTSFTYAIAEIELLVESEQQSQDAVDRIVSFALRHDLETGKHIYGKVAVYLKEEEPEHYQALVDAGVLG